MKTIADSSPESFVIVPKDGSQVVVGFHSNEVAQCIVVQESSHVLINSENKNDLNQRLLTAKGFKNDKDFLKAIEVLENLKSLIEKNNPAENNNNHEIIDLLEQSKIHKKNK